MPKVILNEIIVEVSIDREKLSAEEVEKLNRRMNKDKGARDAVANQVRHILANDIPSREGLEVRVQNMAPE